MNINHQRSNQLKGIIRTNKAGKVRYIMCDGQWTEGRIQQEDESNESVWLDVIWLLGDYHSNPALVLIVTDPLTWSRDHHSATRRASAPLAYRKQSALL